MDVFFAEIWAYFPDHFDTFKTIGWAIVKIILLFIFARVAISILDRIVKRTLKIKGALDVRRRGTLESLFTNVIKYTIYFSFILTVLPIFGVHIGALLAGAGVVGIAVAFGAQSLLKDIFNGFFILFEDQFGIGDYVMINNVWGSVESMGLRITTILVWTGEVETIPNGHINQITNFSKHNSTAVIDVNIGYRTNVEQAVALVDQVMIKLQREEENIIGDVSVLGVQTLNDSTYTLRAIAECHSYTHWGIQRLAKQRIREALEAAGADLPFQKIIYLQDEFEEHAPKGPRQPEQE